MGLTTIIYAHPWEGSFNHAILQAVKQHLDSSGQPYRLLDLYADRFNPVYSEEELALFNKGQALDPQVLSYQDTLKQTERLIFIFPIWWADMPAIVKGFLDKVFLKTLTYVENKRTGLLEGKLTHIQEAVVITTSAAPRFYLKFFCGNVIQRALIGHTLKGVGVGRGRWINFGQITKSTPEKRQAFLDRLPGQL